METTPLLSSASTRQISSVITIEEKYIGRVLPVAFTAAFAIAATSATTIYAYAQILCADPAHCKSDEQNRYAAVVALATTVANVFGVVAVAVLQKWMKTQPKLGLCFWLLSRGTGVAVLALAVHLQDIRIAIAGRVFEGLATDNVLHFTLATIYIRTKQTDRFSRLMITSLASYMAGMSTSPTIVTFLPNFQFSFAVAVILLGTSILYLTLFVPVTTTAVVEENGIESLRKAETKRSLFLDPILFYTKEPVSFLPSLGIFFYNSAQAYIFPAIMVHSALRFGFTSIENGYIISIAASTSSLYLFAVLYAVPKIQKIREDRKALQAATQNPSQEESQGIISNQPLRYRFTSDAFCAFFSMLVLFLGLPCFPLVRYASQIYGLVVLVSLGLAAPSFIKSHAVSIATEKELALVGIAMMESLGGLFSPVVLGAIQSYLGLDVVFIAASSLVGIAILCVAGSLCIGKRK